MPIVAAVIGAAGTLAMAAAIVFERLMHRHRQPGVTYAQSTFRRDGGWRRAELFTEQGLRHQRRASACGVTGALLWVAGLVAWAVLG